MRRALTLGLAALALVVFVRATCGPTPGKKVTVVEKMEFTDHVYYHNMGIAWDGEYYYTINGGNTSYSNLHKYNEDGESEESYDLSVDGRSILCNAEDGGLYIKPFGTDLLTTDLDIEETETEHSEMFRGEQTHVAMSPDGLRLYELFEGKVYVYDAGSGDEETSFRLSSYNTTEELGYTYAIAASDKFLFVWAPNSDKEVLVYGTDGKYVTKFELPRAGFGFSLTWANDMLWVSEDADGSSDGADGTWYGYALEGLE
jgi:DNA-binding beta-propeller fold protein YncE